MTTPKREDRATIERRFIATFLIPDGPARLDDYRALPLEAFSDSQARAAWRDMLALEALDVASPPPRALPFLAIDANLGIGFQADSTHIYAEWFKELGMAGLRKWQAALPLKTTAAQKAELLQKAELCRIVADRPPPPPEPRFLLAGKEIATPGNLVTIIARAKTGKTASVGAMLAAAISAELGHDDVDTLKFSAPNPAGRALLVFDTEQCPSDAHACMMRALGRAEAEKQPAWLHLFAFAGWTAQDLRVVLRPQLELARNLHGGIHAAVLDGVADYVADVNDPKECNPFVQELHGLALEFDCSIVCVIHSNEGRMAGDDGRGHLGKQLTRKAESNLLLKKVGEVTTITSEKQRKAPITEADGVAFTWSPAQHRHVTCGSPADAKLEREIQDLRELAAEVFAGGSLSYGALTSKIREARGCSAQTAERRIAKMRQHRIATNTAPGSYALSPSHPQHPQNALNEGVR